MSDFGPSINASFVSSGTWEADEIIILTGGMIAILVSDEFVVTFPIRDAGQLSFSEPIPSETFREWIKQRKIEIIGIKQVTYTESSSHWRWAPAFNCVSPPNNNPSYKWKMLSSSIVRAIRKNEFFQIIGKETLLTSDEMQELATQARYVAMALHQLNSSIVNIAEYFHKELLAHLSSTQPSPEVYSHIRSLDLAVYVHSFFQAYSAARDHYAVFASLLVGIRSYKKSKSRSVKIDSLSKLFEGVPSSSLQNIRLFNELNRVGLLGIFDDSKSEKFKILSNTWLWYCNDLRNRFTHRYPYGVGKGEELTEFYSSKSDPRIFLVKAFLESETLDPQPDMLRTINNLYQHICEIFIFAADSTGYIKDPPVITLD